MFLTLAQATVPASAAAAAPAAPVADWGILPVVMFYFFAAVVVGSALTVALARNIVRAAAGLLFTLAGMSGFYFILHAEFLAAVQLVVYVGGTLILIIFGVMLTSKSPRITYDPKLGEVIWALLVGALIAFPVILLALAVWGKVASPAGTGELYSLQSLGKTLLDPKGYLAPFELVSVVLLAVMIGAAFLAKARKPRS